MKRYLQHTLAAACLAAFVGPACANASSSATFGNIVITLTDLDLNDGIAPALTFATYGHAYVSGVSRNFGDTSASYSFEHTAAQPHGTLSGGVHGDWSSVSSNLVAADTVVGIASASTSGGALSGLDGFGAYRSYAGGQEPFNNEFTLSPNTKVTFSTTASLHAETTIGYNLEADQAELAYAGLVFGVAGTTRDGTTYRDGAQLDMYATFNVRDDGSTEGVRDSWSGLLSASFSNSTAFTATGMVDAGLSTNGYSAVWDGVSPVPEAENYAMMLAGLALVGGIARRRRPAGGQG